MFPTKAEGSLPHIAERRTLLSAEEAHEVRERLEESRARRRAAIEEFEAIGKERSAADEHAARYEDPQWEERFDRARSEFFAAREKLGAVRQRLNELSSRRRRRVLRREKSVQ